MRPFGRIEDRQGVDAPGYGPPPDDASKPVVDEQPERRYAVSGLGMALVAAGAVGLAIAVFLPFVEPTGLFNAVKEKSLIQHGGWFFLLIALAAVGTAYRNYSGGRRGWAPIVWGMIALGYAIKYRVDKSERTLYTLNTRTSPKPKTDPRNQTFSVRPNEVTVSIP